MMTTALGELRQINSELRELEAQQTSKAREAFKEVCQEVFGKHPELKNFAFGISGREYNDEGLYEGINFVATNVEYEEGEYNYGGYEGSYWDKYDSSWRHNPDKLENQIEEKLREIGDQALVSALGDYNLVVVIPTEGGVEVEIEEVEI